MASSQKSYSVNPDDYKLLEEVGYGASATVYRAIYLPLNDVIAVKCLDLDRCNSNLVCLLFAAETFLSAKLLPCVNRGLVDLVIKFWF